MIRPKAANCNPGNRAHRSHSKITQNATPIPAKAVVLNEQDTLRTSVRRGHGQHVEQGSGLEGRVAAHRVPELPEGRGRRLAGQERGGVGGRWPTECSMPAIQKG